MCAYTHTHTHQKKAQRESWSNKFLGNNYTPFLGDSSAVFWVPHQTLCTHSSDLPLTQALSEVLRDHPSGVL